MICIYPFSFANSYSSHARKATLCPIVPEVDPAKIYPCDHSSGTTPPSNVTEVPLQVL
jgi:hypothetical protein